MKLQLMSDLHVEFWQGSIEDVLSQMLADVDVLVVAGDIGHADKVEPTLNYLAKHYPHVLYVPGNHEYYGSDLGALDHLNLAPNAHNIHQKEITIDGVKFAGATLWPPLGSHALGITRHINDFKLIKGFNINVCHELNRKDCEFLATSDADVFVTHFLPNMECVAEKYRGDPLNDYFVGRAPKYAEVNLFGHTHNKMDFMLCGQRFIANPTGYLGYEEVNFNTKVIQL